MNSNSLIRAFFIIETSYLTNNVLGIKTTEILQGNLKNVQQVQNWFVK